MGFASRKFWLGLTTMSMIVVVGALSGVLPAMGAQVATVVGGLITVYAIYAGGNVASKWVVSKVQPKEEVEAEEEKPQPQDPQGGAAK